MFFLPEKIKVVEVGPRDGFQNVKTWIPTETKINIIEAIIQSGVRSMELTSFVHPKAIPQLKDAAEVSKTILDRHKDLQAIALAPNLIGTRNAYQSGIREVAYVISVSEQHNLANVRRTREQSLEELANIRNEFPDLKIRLDAATTFGCPYAGVVKEDLVLSLIEKALHYNVDTINLCDTIGVANPKQVYEVVTLVAKTFPDVPLCLHLHDTRGMGLANTFAGLQAGITMFETSIGGLGGCPFAPGAAGNTATEDMLNMLQAMNIETGINIEKYLEAVQMIQNLIEPKLTGHMVNACRYDAF